MRIKFLTERRKRNKRKSKLFGLIDKDELDQDLNGKVEDDDSPELKKIIAIFNDLLSRNNKNYIFKIKLQKKRYIKALQKQKSQYENIIRSKYLLVSKTQTNEWFLEFVKARMLLLNISKITFKIKKDEKTGSVDFSHDISFN